MNRRSIEPLEDRRLLAGIALVRGVLFAVGNKFAANDIVVGLTPDRTAVATSVTFLSAASSPINITKTVPLSDHIRLLVIWGGRGNDSITIDQTTGSFPIPARIAGGPGNDTITGGDSPETVNGGPGNDSITAGAGREVLLGGAGNDTLTAGSGGDWMCGGPGRNLLVGGSGNDTLVSWHGGDTLLGGSGHDLFRTIGLRYSDNNYDPNKDAFQRLIPPSSGGRSSPLHTLLGDFLGF